MFHDYIHVSHGSWLTSCIGLYTEDQTAVSCMVHHPLSIRLIAHGDHPHIISQRLPADPAVAELGKDHGDAWVSEGRAVAAHAWRAADDPLPLHGTRLRWLQLLHTMVLLLGWSVRLTYLQLRGMIGDIVGDVKSLTYGLVVGVSSYRRRDFKGPMCSTIACSCGCIVGASWWCPEPVTVKWWLVYKGKTSQPKANSNQQGVGSPSCLQVYNSRLNAPSCTGVEIKSPSATGED